MSLGHQLIAQRAIDVGCAPVGLQIDSDDLPVLGEGRQQFAEHLDRANAAMQQDQRLSGAVDLIVQMEAVHGSVATLGVLVRCHTDFSFHFSPVRGSAIQALVPAFRVS